MPRRIRSIISLLGLVTAPLAAQQQPRPPDLALRRGMVVTASVRIRPGIYRLPGAGSAADSAIVTIRGDGVTVDFTGVTLEGLAPSAAPDGAQGVGILVDGGRDVRIRGARVRGYKVGLLARNTRGLVIDGGDFGHNWKPRLFSVVEHESLVDWLSHHHNEADEWLRFGAGIYLSDVHGGEVRGNRIEQGMEGLLLVRSDSLRIRNNVIEFNSGVGIGLYRSSDNTIVHNHASYNVRGYSHGFYRRGQDSADLLLYEQSSRNVVAFNSMTHGGDGLFLWAGQSTMDTGAGGANDNLFYANDFSFAPTNAMEATFSRNRFIGNRVEGSDNGLWGGYSYESRISGNRFGGNRTGIAIEHGQDNAIAGNLFDRDAVAINLWADPIESSDWGYPRHRDTRSRDYRITDNRFDHTRVGLRVAHTSGAVADGNRFAAVDTVLAVRDSSEVRRTANDTAAVIGAMTEYVPVPADGVLPAPLADGLRLADDSLGRRDRAAIIVDEWGPYDWRYPRLWPVDSSRVTPLPLRVLGPAGRWRVVSRRGIAALSRDAGPIGDTVLVTPARGAERDWELVLEYRGGATTSPRGLRHAAGAPYRFAYGRFEPAADWRVDFFTWSDSTDPRSQPAAFAALLGGPPLLTRDEPRLDYMWYRPTVPGLPQARLAARATTTVDLAPGSYTLRTISDDAVRVWVDGRLMIDDWTPHESQVDHVSLSAGRHALRVEYAQVDGWAELRVEVVRGDDGSEGSPGQH